MAMGGTPKHLPTSLCEGHTVVPRLWNNHFSR